ncbi:MAG: hypothetical protein WEB52_12430 [Dehalococcoidia bacterium]
MTDWPSIRAGFPITERNVYLNTGWAGPSTRETIAAMHERAEREAYDGPQTVDGATKRRSSSVACVTPSDRLSAPTPTNWR